MGILFVELHDQETQGFDTPTGLVTGNAALYDFRAHLSKIDRTNRRAFGQGEAHSFMATLALKVSQHRRSVEDVTRLNLRSHAWPLAAAPR